MTFSGRSAAKLFCRRGRLVSAVHHSAIWLPNLAVAQCVRDIFEISILFFRGIPPIGNVNRGEYENLHFCSFLPRRFVFGAKCLQFCSYFCQIAAACPQSARNSCTFAGIPLNWPKSKGDSCTFAVIPLLPVVSWIRDDALFPPASRLYRTLVHRLSEFGGREIKPTLTCYPSSDGCQVVGSSCRDRAPAP
jgi:hypothetical protein